MTNKEYENIILYGEKTEWYESLVPKELLTPKVLYSSELLEVEINKLKDELINYKGAEKEKKSGYIKALEYNLINYPYILNNDFYLKKKKLIESNIKKTKKK